MSRKTASAFFLADQVILLAGCRGTGGTAQKLKVTESERPLLDKANKSKPGVYPSPHATMRQPKRK